GLSATSSCPTRRSSDLCSRRTSPGPTPSRPYVATTEQVWALYDAFTDRYQLAVLLGAFAGLRVAEVCGLRVEDVDFLGRVITPRSEEHTSELQSRENLV